MKLTGPINGLHFMRNNSVVIDTTHGLIHLPHLTMQVKTTSSETTTKKQPVITEEALNIPPTTTKTITAFIDHPFEMEHNRHCDTVAEVYGNSKSADFSLNVDNN